MKNLIKLALLPLILSVSLVAQADKIDRIVEVEENGRINIEIMDGIIVIEGWDKPQVRVVGELPLKGHNFSFESNGSNTKIEHTGEHGFWNKRTGGGSYADLTIYAPRNSSFRIDSTSAEYLLKGIQGQVRANTMSGDISLEGGNGSVDLQSVSGNVIVTGSSGRLNLSSVSGNIRADGEAEQFEAQTVSGDIRARIDSSNRINLESVSGDIDVSVKLGQRARLDADTVSGDIEVEFDSGPINASFEIETGPGGSVNNSLSDDKAEKSFSFSGSMRFTLGSGDRTISLETMSGSINIDQQ
ncbi:MAG: DUF4097 and DUF4098 domain-containing protein YvlB [Arenicella sp.]|jgi:DUF4097 and DUF4098 domain-containing protein YvlB